MKRRSRGDSGREISNSKFQIPNKFQAQKLQPNLGEVARKHLKFEMGLGVFIGNWVLEIWDLQNPSRNSLRLQIRL